MLSNENSDYESTLKMKQTKIDEQKKQLKLINASYAELKYKVSEFLVLSIYTGIVHKQLRTYSTYIRMYIFVYLRSCY